MATLQVIESDDLKTLPPMVYLRNFLKAYADIFHADTEKIAAGYLKNLDRLGRS